MALELIGFPLCPFVQRVLIVLKEKGLDCQVIWIDPDDPPGWLAEITSPGRLPMLRVARLTELFDPQAICEYLEELARPCLHPVGPLARAQDRDWAALASELTRLQQELAGAGREADYRRARAALAEGLAWVAAAWTGGPYWHGSRFCQVDAAFAPLFQRLLTLAGERPELAGLMTGALPEWAATLQERSSVRDSVPPDFSARYGRHLRQLGAFVLAPAASPLA
jgi:glutathione S-transferase